MTIDHIWSQHVQVCWGWPKKCWKVVNLPRWHPIGNLQLQKKTSCNLPSVVRRMLLPCYIFNYVGCCVSILAHVSHGHLEPPQKNRPSEWTPRWRWDRRGWPLPRRWWAVPNRTWDVAFKKPRISGSKVGRLQTQPSGNRNGWLQN